MLLDEKGKAQSDLAKVSAGRVSDPETRAARLANDTGVSLARMRKDVQYTKAVYDVLKGRRNLSDVTKDMSEADLLAFHQIVREEHARADNELRSTIKEQQKTDPEFAQRIEEARQAFTESRVKTLSELEAQIAARNSEQADMGNGDLPNPRVAEDLAREASNPDSVRAQNANDLPLAEGDLPRISRRPDTPPTALPTLSVMRRLSGTRFLRPRSAPPAAIFQAETRPGCMIRLPGFTLCQEPPGSFFAMTIPAKARSRSPW